MRKLLKRMSPARIIALGFAAAIFIGSGLLMLPCSVQNGVDLKYIDALYTSASAVCVTGLVTVDIGDTFTAFGQFVVAALIQIGGLGVASMGAGVILAVGKRINLKGRRVLRDAMNLDSGKGIVKFIKSVFLTTAAFELVGAALSFIVFVRDYPPLKALGISLFHSVAAFNNSGFDILGNFQSLSAYKEDVFLNLVTCLLIFFGGIGFLVIREIVEKRFRWRRFSMHTKVVLNDERCTDGRRRGDFQNYREYAVDRSPVQQRDREDGGLLDIFARRIFKRGTARYDISYVRRRVARLHRRRYKDEHAVCADPGHKDRRNKHLGKGVSLFRATRRVPQGVGHSGHGYKCDISGNVYALRL